MDIFASSDRNLLHNGAEAVVGEGGSHRVTEQLGLPAQRRWEAMLENPSMMGCLDDCEVFFREIEEVRRNDVLGVALGQLLTPRLPLWPWGLPVKAAT